MPGSWSSYTTWHVPACDHMQLLGCCLSRSLKWQNVSISVPPAATYSCQGSRRTRTVSCHWANDMELVLKWSSWSWSEHWQLSTHSQDVSVWTTRRVLSALEALCDNALYKSTFTFTLHHYPTDSYQSQFIVMMCTDLADVALHG